MIQFKKIPLGKSAILFLLFLTTTTTGFLRNNEDEYRTTRNDENVRETLLSMDRREENVQVQNLPIRKLDIDRQINEKDNIAERLYDRRSFRTGTIEQISQDVRRLDRRQITQNRDTTRASRDMRADVRDVDNNRRVTARSNDRRASVSNILQENRRQVRQNGENRRITERTVISRNRHFNEGRRLSNIGTDERKTERRVVPEHRVLSNPLASVSITGSRNTQNNVRGRDIRDNRSNVNVRQTRDQIQRTNDLQRRTIRLGERQDALNRQIETPNRELNQIDRRFVERNIQVRSTRENNADNRMRSRAILNRDGQMNQARLLEDRRVTVRSLENEGERLSNVRNVDQIRSPDRRRSTENLERRNSREYSRNVFEIRASNVADRQRSVERREDNAPRRVRTRMTRELSERDTETQYSPRSADNQNRRTSERRNIERTLSLEDWRFTTRSSENQDRRSTFVRTVERTRLLDRQGSTERLEKARSRAGNFLDIPAINEVNRQSRLSDRLRSTQLSERDITRSNSLQRRDVDQRRQRSVDSREDRITTEGRVRDEARSDSTRNIRDNTQFRRDVQPNNRIINRQDSKLSRENQRENSYNRQRLSVSSKNEIMDTERYNQLTVDSSRYFEKLVSQRTTRDSERAALDISKNVDDLNMKVDSNIWVNTAKIVLAAFLIGQIFVNSSKQNKFRFQNIMSMATLAKQKIE